MRLLNTKTLEVEEFLAEIPKYAILSHTWEKDEEVTFQDIQILQKAENLKKAGLKETARPVQLLKTERIKKKNGWLKIKKTCDFVRRYKFKWVWIDTCCIDKSSSAELSEALNSMYNYYGDAHVCITYLSDVSNGRNLTDLEVFKKSRWFKRGWTLQELIAPRHMVFLDQGWNMIGTRFSMRHIVSKVTSVPVEVFESRGIEHYSIAQKMSWAASRETTREEDMAYCLMGLFGVNIPPIYGEGGAKAFMRLQQEIIKYSDDRSIFAWVASHDHHDWDRGLFASSPSEFLSSGDIHRSESQDLRDKSSFTFSNNGLHIHLFLQPLPDIEKDIFLASLHCRDANSVIGIYLQKDSQGRYIRWCPHFPLHHWHTQKPMEDLQEVVVKEGAVPRQKAKYDHIPFEFKLDPQFTLLDEVDDNLRISPLEDPMTFRLCTKNGNHKFEIALYNSHYDIIPMVLASDRSIMWNDSPPLRDSHLLSIGNENELASCFVHRTGDSLNRTIVEINYIPSSSPKFEYYQQIDEFQRTPLAHPPRSTTLNFTLDTPLDISPYPSDIRWKRGNNKTYGSISFTGDVHCVFQLFRSGKDVFITLGLRTDSKHSLPWMDICIPENELQISNVWQSYRPLGSRYALTQQIGGSQVILDRATYFTATVEKMEALEASWYHVVTEYRPRWVEAYSSPPGV